MAKLDARLDPAKFEELLSGPQSWRMIYLKAHICPCRSAQTGAPQSNCPACSGSGYTWQSPASNTRKETFYSGSQTKPAKIPPEAAVTAVSTEGAALEYTLEGGIVRPVPDLPYGSPFVVTYTSPAVVQGLITGMTNNRAAEEQGVWEHKRANLTLGAYLSTGVPNPAYNADEFDRFVVLDARQPYQQVLFRGNDRLLFSYVFGISAVYSLDSEYERTEYTQGEDFTLTNGRIVWADEAGPAMGHPYAVQYECAPEFYVFRSSDLVRHHGGDALPRRLGIVAWQLWPKNGVSR